MVDPSIADRRQAIINQAEAYFARRSEMPIKSEDEASERLVTLEFKDGNPLVMITLRAEGVTPAMWNWYQEGEDGLARKVDKAYQLKLLETHDDHFIMFQRIITPPLVSNRSIVHIGWNDYQPESTSLYITTSVGNEVLNEKYREEIGNDVLATCFMAYFEVKPTSDGRGIYLRMILNVDVAGSLPNFVKRRIGEEQCKTADDILEYIKKNYNP